MLGVQESLAWYDLEAIDVDDEVQSVRPGLRSGIPTSNAPAIPTLGYVETQGVCVSEHIRFG
jgi:hypothetical protein